VATLKDMEEIENLYLSENGEYLMVLTSESESVHLWSLKNLYN
jgi:hypothetical protein